MFMIHFSVGHSFERFERLRRSKKKDDTFFQYQLLFKTAIFNLLKQPGLILIYTTYDYINPNENWLKEQANRVRQQRKRKKTIHCMYWACCDNNIQRTHTLVHCMYVCHMKSWAHTHTNKYRRRHIWYIRKRQFSFAFASARFVPVVVVRLNVCVLVMYLQWNSLYEPSTAEKHEYIRIDSPTMGDDNPSPINEYHMCTYNIYKYAHTTLIWYTHTHTYVHAYTVSRRHTKNKVKASNYNKTVRHIVF